jgi:hypothetical protein
MVSARAKVILLDGDLMIGESLEALLQASGYRARFLSETNVDRIGEVLVDSQLLILPPALSPEFRKVLSDTILRGSAAGVPVLELLPVDGDQSVRGEHIVPWPCSLEKLKLAIESALSPGSESP